MGEVLVKIKPLSLYIVLIALAGLVAGAPVGLKATGVPEVTLKIVIAVPSLLVIVTLAVPEAEDTTNSLASEE